MPPTAMPGLPAADDLERASVQRSRCPRPSSDHGGKAFRDPIRRGGMRSRCDAAFAHRAGARPRQVRRGDRLRHRARRWREQVQRIGIDDQRLPAANRPAQRRPHSPLPQPGPSATTSACCSIEASACRRSCTASPGNAPAAARRTSRVATRPARRRRAKPLPRTGNTAPPMPWSPPTHSTRPLFALVLSRGAASAAIRRAAGIVPTIPPRADAVERGTRQIERGERQRACMVQRRAGAQTRFRRDAFQRARRAAPDAAPNRDRRRRRRRRWPAPARRTTLIAPIRHCPPFGRAPGRCQTARPRRVDGIETPASGFDATAGRHDPRRRAAQDRCAAAAVAARAARDRIRAHVSPARSRRRRCCRGRRRPRSAAPAASAPALPRQPAARAAHQHETVARQDACARFDRATRRYRTIRQGSGIARFYTCAWANPPRIRPTALAAAHSRRWRRRAGFQRCGISGIDLDEDESHLRDWLRGL